MRETQGGEPHPRTIWQAFTQQRLRAWQPILAPRWIISIFLVGGVVFLGLGSGLLLLSRQVTEFSRDYTDTADPGTGVGSFSLQITEDMQPPIWVYYQLDGFHQNHRRYVQSRDDAQLRDDPSAREKPGQAQCEPWVAGEDGRTHYPCGLVARSVFNDSFALVLRRPGGAAAAPAAGELLAVDSRAQTIAWPADRGRFRNLDPEAPAARGPQGEPNARALDMWLLERFPPVACEQTEISGAAPFAPVRVARRNETLGGGGAVEVADCRGYTSERPSCNFVREGAPFECSGPHYRQVVRREDWGVESGHFIVWMRVSGLPSFRKLWGKLDTALPAGSVLQVHVSDNFEVKGFRGRKAFVISTSSALGGRNDFLGWGYMLVGSCCLVFGAAFLWKSTVRGSRPPRDLTLLSPAER